MNIIFSFQDESRFHSLFVNNSLLAIYQFSNGPSYLFIFLENAVLFTNHVLLVKGMQTTLHQEKKSNFFGKVFIVKTSCKCSVARRVRVKRLKQKLRCMYLYQNNKACENLLLYILSMILVEKAQYNSCCFFVVKRSKNYNAVVSRQNI